MKNNIHTHIPTNQIISIGEVNEATDTTTGVGCSAPGIFAILGITVVPIMEVERSFPQINFLAYLILSKL